MSKSKELPHDITHQAASG